MIPTPGTQNSSSALIVPKLNIKLSWKLTKSITFTTELYEIKKALKNFYNCKNDEITVFTNSLAALKAIEGHQTKRRILNPEMNLQNQQYKRINVFLGVFLSVYCKAVLLSLIAHWSK